MASEPSYPSISRLKRALVHSEIRHLAGHSEVLLRPDSINEMTERVGHLMRLTAAGGLADADGKTLLFYLTTKMRLSAGHLYRQADQPNTGGPRATIFGARQ